MNTLWTAIATLVVVFGIRSADGYCTLGHISSTCEYYINCINDINNLVELRYRIRCPTISYESNSKIFLNLNDVNLDLSDDIQMEFYNDIKMLSLNHVDKISERIKDFTNLEEIALTDWLDRKIVLNRFIDFNFQHLTKINASYNNIEVLENSDFHIYYLRGKTRVNNIDLSHNLLETIPNNVFYHFSSELKYLNLSYNLIKNIETSSFEGIDSLETLDISYNKLVEIGLSFAKFSNVREIFLQNNNISSITEPNFKALVNLEKLNLSSNILETIEDDAFRALGNLKEIDLSNNKLTRVSKVLFWSNTNIFQLFLENNKIQTIESDAFKGKNITSFNVQGNDLRDSLQRNSFIGVATDNLNLSYGKIYALEAAAFAGLQTQVLNLSNNILTNIHAKSFRGIIFVTELNLSNNNLTKVDFETEDLSQLLIFKARNNQITDVSQMFIKNFVALTKLDLSHNKLTVLDTRLFLELNRLEFLDLSNNFLVGSLKTNLFQGLSAVTNIHLEHNRFTDIENGTFNGLKSLKIINCSSGELTNIHFDAFKNTGSLEALDLSQNFINNFVVNVASTTSVKKLRLNDNKIHNVTIKTISGFSYLEELYFSNNNIIVLESKLFRALKKLKVLDLSNNPAIESNEILSNLSFLTELKLSNIKNQFNFDKIINISIIRLELSHNSIENINEVFVYKINDIHYLDLQANKIASIDKDSFRNMPTLMWLDLSFNLITYIQPGSFLQTKGLKTLNLHENALSSLQYGALNGLYDLETLNLSSNAIHEFRKAVLINTPKISTIALDNNAIEHIKFEEFVPSSIKLITIGGNPISCHVIADFIERNRFFKVSAEILDHHYESIHGIKCISNSNVNINSYHNTSGDGSAVSGMMYKAFENFRTSLDKILGSIDRINFKNESEEIRNTQKSIIKILLSINVSQNDTNNYLKLQTNAMKIDTIEELLKKINSSQKIDTNSHDTNKNDKNEIDHYLQDKIKILNNEKDKMVKEMYEIIEEMKSNKNLKSSIELTRNDKEYDSMKGVLNFVAVCLVILILFAVAFLFKYFKLRYMFKRGNIANCSSQQMANIIELQEN